MIVGPYAPRPPVAEGNPPANQEAAPLPAFGPTEAEARPIAKGRPWVPLVAALLPVLVLLFLLAYGFPTDPRAIPSPLVRAPAPDFTLTLFDGSPVKLTDYRGKAVVLNFWASWCIPCREEAPLLEAAWRALKDRNVVFLGVNIQDSQEAATGFIREFGLSFPNGRDAAGKIAIDYGVYGIPETFFIDRQGRITGKVIGPLGAETLVARAREALQGIASAEERRPGFQSVR